MEESPNNGPSTDAKQRDSKKNIPPIVGQPSATSPQPAPAESDGQKSQRRRRRWTNDPPMFWVTLAGVIAVILYTSVAAWQACLTRGQLDAMQADQRPWVGIKSLEPAGTLFKDKDSVTFSVKYELQNAGHSVAHDAFFYFNFIQDFDDKTIVATSPIDGSVEKNWPHERIIGVYTSAKTVLKYCKDEFEMNLSRSFRNPAFVPAPQDIFPNDSTSKEAAASSKDTLGVTSITPIDSDRPYQIFLIACVRYSEHETGTQRFTATTYELKKIGVGADSFLPPAGNVDSSNLRLEKYSQYGD